MPFVLILIGVVLLVVAIRDTYGSLGQALGTDIPAYAPWALALAGVGLVGFVPGLQRISRWLLLLVLALFVLKNYTAILSGFSGMTTTGQATTPPQTPSQAYSANPQAPIPAQDVAGIGTTTTGTQQAGLLGSGGNINANAAPALASAVNPYDPNSYLTGFLANAGFGAA